MTAASSSHASFKRRLRAETWDLWNDCRGAQRAVGPASSSNLDPQPACKETIYSSSSRRHDVAWQPRVCFRIKREIHEGGNEPKFDKTLERCHSKLNNHVNDSPNSTIVSMTSRKDQLEKVYSIASKQSSTEQLTRQTWQNVTPDEEQELILTESRNLMLVPATKTPQLKACRALLQQLSWGLQEVHTSDIAFHVAAQTVFIVSLTTRHRGSRRAPYFPTFFLPSVFWVKVYLVPP